MEELLEYARVVFEERYMCKASPFTCVRPQVEQDFCRCSCIPGVAMNYITCVLECCYKEFQGKSSINWDEERHIYFSYNEYQKQKIVFNLQMNENLCRCYFSEDLCGEGINEYSYIKIRPYEVLWNTYLKGRKSFIKESLLYRKTEKFDNCIDYLRLFCLIADTYRMDFDGGEFADKLFRLFFFLFPYTGIEVFDSNFKAYGDSEEFNGYNKQLLQSYIELGKGKRKDDPLSDTKFTSTIQQLKDFLGFDFLSIWKKYESPFSCGEIRDLKSVLNKQMNICNKLSSRIEKMVNKLQ